MGEVIDVRFRQHNERGMFFPQKNLYFPPLRKALITWDSYIDESGIIVRETVPKQEIVYTINPNYEDTIAAEVSSEIVDRVHETDGPTIVIRHHASKESAMSYLDGVADCGIPEWETDRIIQTDQGFFTLVRRGPVNHGRCMEEADKGPFVFYIGVYDKIHPVFGPVEDSWECRTDRLGDTVIDELLQEFPE